MKFSKLVAKILISGFILVGCSDDKLSDAYGQFEATEVAISSETQGRILSFNIREGDRLEQERIVAVIDTMQHVLKKRELEASLRVVETGVAKLNAQKGVILARLETAESEHNRLRALYEDNAATLQQLDRARGEVTALQRQIHAIETERLSVFAEMDRMNAMIDQVNDQIRRSSIINPLNGTVLTKFAEVHELVTPGKPLYRLANLDEMILKVYVSGDQLPGVIIGAEVEVFIDRNRRENERLTVTVSWVSPRAEFTPRMIQTKEERVSQVYAVHVIVENPEGKIKIGMPGEVNF